jgi:3-deoxy-7-phosphoheptulonate synthase
MIIVTRPNVTDAELDHIRERVEGAGLRVHLSRGEQRTILGCIGDERLFAALPLQSLPGVESVTPVLKPYKLASREFSADRSAVRVAHAYGASVAVFGGEAVAVIAGPCSVEGRNMLRDSAAAVTHARMARPTETAAELCVP